MCWDGSALFAQNMGREVKIQEPLKRTSTVKHLPAFPLNLKVAYLGLAIDEAAECVLKKRKWIFTKFLAVTFCPGGIFFMLYYLNQKNMHILNGNSTFPVFFKLRSIVVQLLYNVVLVSTTQQSKSVIHTRVCVCVCVRAMWLQSYPTLCDPVDCRPPSFSIHEILQARILEWVAILSPGDLPNPGVEAGSPTLQVDSLSSEPPGKPRYMYTHG